MIGILDFGDFDIINGDIMIIRRFKNGEESILMDVFISSIRENAKTYYNDSQLKSWASDDIDAIGWEKRIQGINPYVIIDSDVILGYADLQDTGYIDHFFVRGKQSGKGIGAQLMNYILDQAKEQEIVELTSDVSLAAQGFFEKFGFEIIKRKKVLIRGVELENALMLKKLR